MHPVQHYETIRKGQEELRRRVMEVRKMHKLRAKTWVRPHTGRSHTDTLLYSPDFLKLWIGESVSMMGSQVTLLAFFFQGIGITGCNVHVDSIRQALIPDKLQGRANASYRLLVSGTLPVGALLGGFLGQQFGLQVALFVGALGLLSTWLWVIFSPVRGLQTLPKEAYGLSSEHDRMRLTDEECEAMNDREKADLLASEQVSVPEKQGVI